MYILCKQDGKSSVADNLISIWRGDGGATPTISNLIIYTSDKHINYINDAVTTKSWTIEDKQGRYSLAELRDNVDGKIEANRGKEWYKHPALTNVNLNGQSILGDATGASRLAINSAGGAIYADSLPVIE